MILNSWRNVIRVSGIVAFTVVLVSCVCALKSDSIQATELRDALLTHDNKPTEKLCAVLDFFAIKHDGTLPSIVAATQKFQPEGFLRAKDKERWELTPFKEENRAIIFSLLNDIDMISAVVPAHKHYTHAVILGAMLGRVRMRMAYLLDLYKKGVRFDHIVFLGGKRPLDPTVEPRSSFEDTKNGILPIRTGWVMNTVPTTELEMMQMVWDQMEKPAEWNTIPVVFVDAPMKMVDGKLVRPSTVDTIIAWMAQKPAAGSVLAISSQPHVGYQDAVLLTDLPAEYSLETVGPVAPQSTEVAVAVDALARWLYQENIRRK